MEPSLPPCGDWGIDLMDKCKLQWRIFGFLLAFCGLLLTILWLFQTVFLTDTYKLVRRSEIQSAISLVEQNIDSPDFARILTTLQNEQEILVMPTHTFQPPPRPAPEEPGKRKPEAITETRRFRLASGEEVSLTFYAMITPVSATVSTLRVQLYCISGVLILLSVLLAVIISRRISKPIVTMNASAKQLATGQYDVQFEGHGFLEIRELSDTLNTAAEELSKVEGLRRELMANVSHDLRTPLALIYSHAEMMHDFPDEVTPEHCRTIMEEAKRLSSLVDDVMDLSHLETGEGRLHLEDFCLTTHVRNEVARMAELLEQEGYQIRFFAERDLWVHADRVKINRAFYNLLVNAVNYTGERKEILVSQEEDEGSVRISIKDCGEGIAPEDLPHIWERYYKVDKLHRRPVTGTGLGLSIVRNLILLHGGSYGVDSKLGQGSTFWVQIPRIKTPEHS